MEAYFMQKHNVKLIGAPVDGNTAAITGARVPMAQGDRLVIMLLLSASTGAVLPVALKQHNAGSGGTTKALAISNPVFYKAGVATSFTKQENALDSAGILTKVSDYDMSTIFAADGGVLVFEVLQEDLDVNGDFTHVSVDIADTTAAKIVAGVYITSQSRWNPAYNQAI